MHLPEDDDQTLSLRTLYSYAHTHTQSLSHTHTFIYCEIPFVCVYTREYACVNVSKCVYVYSRACVRERDSEKACYKGESYAHTV